MYKEYVEKRVVHADERKIRPRACGVIEEELSNEGNPEAEGPGEDVINLRDLLLDEGD